MKTTKKAFFKLLQKAATQVAPSTVPKTEAIKRHMDACRSLLDVPDYDVLYVAIEALKARAEATLKERDSWRESWQKEKARAETAESLLKHIAHTYCGIDIGGETTLDMVPAFVEGQIDKQSDRADAAERQRDACIAEANRTSEKWMSGINECLGETLDYRDPSAHNAASSALTRWAKEKQAKLEAAEKCCAEMRTALKTLVTNLCADGGGTPVYPNKFVESALSSDCGQSYVPKAELDAIKKAAVRTVVFMWDATDYMKRFNPEYASLIQSEGELLNKAIMEAKG